MKKKNPNIEKALYLSLGRTPRKGVYIVLLILYLATSFIVSATAGDNQGVIMVGGAAMPIYSFAGIFSALANITIMLIVVYFGKLGFYTALIALMIQIPALIYGIVARGNITSLPGAFTDLFTIIAIIIIYVNNNEIDRYQKRLYNHAVTDTLTGLPNGFAMNEFTNDLVKKGQRFAAVSIDLNNFKSINDTMGHSTGNEILIEIASRWKEATDSGASGTNDFIMRIGGDEFCLIIRDFDSLDDIQKTIKYYESVLEKVITIDECDYYMTASFGYAVYPDDSRTAEALFSNADAAMYEIKRSNSSEHILRFTREILKIERSLEIERKIRSALDNDTIFFHLQPQFDISHNLRGFEALARMKDTDGTMISPAEFIPVAEKVGLIDKVDFHVFRNAACFFGELIKNTGTDITLSVNVSVRHLMKNDFLDEVREVIELSGVPADQIEIEITESIMIDSADKALQCINELKAMGIKIAIDDFGTGYSSLSYLHNFPADLLKVDKSFIDSMNTSDSSKKYVASIISIGHIMNFDVISEGVEDVEQLDTLRSIGCDFIQGFVWGRPMMPEDAEMLVKEFSKASS